MPGVFSVKLNGEPQEDCSQIFKVICLVLALNRATSRNLIDLAF